MESTTGISSRLRKQFFGTRLSKAIFAGLTAVALIVALQQFYIINLNAETRYSLLWHIPFNLFYFWFWFIIFPLIYRIAAKSSIEKSRFTYWGSIYFFTPVTLVILHQVIASLVINISLDYLDIPTLVYKRILRNPWLGLDFIIYFVILMAIYVFEWRQKNKDEELRLNRLQSQLAQSQLSALESQLHPHFLFNTLNTVSTQILKKEGSEAERMLSLLRDFLETTIYGTTRHMIALEEELQFIGRYLEIEKVRFKGRLEVRENVSRDALKAEVPTLLLQPIIENSIRYAIAPKKSGGIISISAARENGRLSIMIEDNGPGLTRRTGDRTNEGVGLRITREKLLHFYGSDHIFEMTGRDGGGLVVRIEVPVVEPGNTVHESYHAA